MNGSMSVTGSVFTNGTLTMTASEVINGNIVGVHSRELKEEPPVFPCPTSVRQSSMQLHPPTPIVAAKPLIA